MAAKQLDTEFFDKKRPWSRLKDQVVGHYLPVFLRKVGKKTSADFVLVDAFAGPGVFKEPDGSNLPGSPLVICSQAEKHANGRYTAYFGNVNTTHHKNLTNILENTNGGLVSQGRAKPLLKDSYELLKEVKFSLTNESVLIYLDPFGIKGCGFNRALKPYLERDPQFVTEIIINMSVPVLFRLAGKPPNDSNELDTQTKSYHHRTFA